MFMYTYTYTGVGNPTGIDISVTTPQRRTWSNDGDLETGESQRERDRMNASTAPPSLSSIDEWVRSPVGTDDAASDDTSCPSLTESALSVYSQLDSFD